MFGGAVFGGAVFGGAVFGGAVFGGAVFGGAVFGGAVFGGAVFGGAVFGGAVFGGAVFGGAVFGGAVLGGAVLGGAVLGGAVGRWVAVFPCPATGANCPRTMATITKTLIDRSIVFWRHVTAAITEPGPALVHFKTICKSGFAYIALSFRALMRLNDRH